MKNEVILCVMILLGIIVLGLCGCSSKRISESKLKEIVPEEVLTYRLLTADGFSTEEFKQEIVDLEIEKGYAEDNCYIAYAKIHVTDENMECNLYHKFTCRKYDRGGWQIEAYEEYEPYELISVSEEMAEIIKRDWYSSSNYEDVKWEMFGDNMLRYSYHVEIPYPYLILKEDEKDVYNIIEVIGTEERYYKVARDFESDFSEIHVEYMIDWESLEGTWTARTLVLVGQGDWICNIVIKEINSTSVEWECDNGNAITSGISDVSVEDANVYFIINDYILNFDLLNESYLLNDYFALEKSSNEKTTISNYDDSAMTSDNENCVEIDMSISEFPDWYEMNKTVVYGNQVCYARDDCWYLNEDSEATPMVWLYTCDDDGNVIKIEFFLVFESEEEAVNAQKELELNGDDVTRNSNILHEFYLDDSVYSTMEDLIKPSSVWEIVYK